MGKCVLPMPCPTLGDARQEEGILPNLNTRVRRVCIQKHRCSHNSLTVVVTLDGLEIRHMLTAREKAFVGSHVYLR